MPPPIGFDRSKYVSPAEVAAAWGVSPEAVRRLCRLGKVPGAVLIAERPGPGATKRWHIPREQAEKYSTDDTEDQRALAGVA
jgi:hypothetical protein